MKLPIVWLKKYIDVNLSPSELAESLTLSGSKVDSVENGVIDIEVTTNRPDCLSILGLAHEVAAISGNKVKRPSAYSLKEKKAQPALAPSIVIEDKKGCPRYTGRVLRDVRVVESPAEAQKFLSLAGTRAICNVVDVTNFVLFECGQPMHAFDLDKIRGGKLIVRRSKTGEKFLGIDGIEYTLDDKTLVIADAERPVALAGVIGGKQTEVTSSTKNILLESAYFDPVRVRQASKKYKVSTESSYRFERGVDIENVGGASARASELIREWAGGQDVTGLIDKDYSSRLKRRSVLLRLQRVEALLGMKVSQSRVSSILKSLSFTVQPAGTGRLKVTPDSSRRDITLEADLAEEILRIEGFDKAPQTLPPARFAVDRYIDKKAERLPELKKFVAHLGFDEIMTYSLLSEKALTQSGLDAAKCHAIANAVSAEQAFFRPSLLPGALQAVAFNAHRKATGLKFFEVGNCYNEGREETRLSLVLYGMFEENWQRKAEADFYDLKGVMENVLDHLGVSEAPLTRFSPVPEELLKAWDIPRPVFFCEMLLDSSLSKSVAVHKVRPVPKFPCVRRDIAFIVDRMVPVSQLQQVMLEAAAPYIQEASLFDQFTGKSIPADKRSLAFSIAYQKEDATFTDQEIQELQARVSTALKSRFQVEFR